MAKLIDITLSLDAQTLLYPGDEPLQSTQTVADGLAFTEVRMGMHTGTHVDAPAHFLPDGPTLGQIPLAHFHGPATVIDVPSEASEITAADLQYLALEPQRHLLLKTRNAQLLREFKFTPNYSSLQPAAAEFLLTLKPLSIGFDYYSLDPVNEAAYPAHRLCAEAGIPVYACLDLLEVAAGPYYFSGLPLKLQEAEASPVRAVLWKE